MCVNLQPQKITYYFCQTLIMQNVVHSAIVTQVFKGYVTVILSEVSGCSTCQLKSACGADQVEVKEFKVLTGNEQYQKGDAVTIGMHQSMGLKAVFLAYVVPFIILMTVILLSQRILKEWVAGFLVITFIAVYYWLLKCMDHYISKHIHIQILKTT